ncbi:hypothetical protein Ocin01_14091 [Orchesella cincta]|uniref:Uncharacterized protein n=1 Tax=Orchesella cincta TaxID=48709 RepID=A0A1D2MI53_ORCCI|nr:hypothetical protein Ocin01_14091 [Orchesella cincta]
MAKFTIVLLALVVLFAVASAAPMGFGMGIGHGMVSSHHVSHVGHGFMHHPFMWGYPGIIGRGFYPGMMWG